MTKWEEIFLCLSKSRLESFYDKQSDLPQDVINKYNTHLDENTQFYKPLHLLEIIMRNRIHTAVGELVHNPQWLMSIKNREQTNFFIAIHKFDSKTVEFFLRQIDEAYSVSLKTSKQNQRSVLEDDLIANLNFGFWTFMLNSKYSNLLHDKGFFLKVFPYFLFKEKPPSKFYYKSEAELRAKIDTIRKIRNRVFHHEKINNFPCALGEIKEILKYLSEHSFNAFFI